jgi:hypothetical protein
MDKLDSKRLEELFSALGAHLAAGGHSSGIVVVGGSTLALKGWVERTTQGVDVIAQAVRDEGGWTLVPSDPLPEPLVSAVARVARDYGLAEDWLNTTIGAQWNQGLPPGFSEELEWRSYSTLHVGFAGRQSLIALKLYAAVDQGPESVHLQDLLALAPTNAELNQAAEWVMVQDAAESFPALVHEVVEHVRGS